MNNIQLPKEQQTLADAGYRDPVSVGDYSLNVHDFGNKEGKHTFAGVSAEA